MSKKKVTLNIDSRVYGDFKKYCETNAIMLSKRIELFMKDFVKTKALKLVLILAFWVFLMQFASADQIFTDGFEDNDISDWTVTPGSTSGWYVTDTESPAFGTYHVVARNTDSETVLSRGISTEGYQDIVFSFWWATDTNLLESGDYYEVDWYDGSSWTNIFSLTAGSQTTYILESNNLPSAASDNPNFEIRFRCNVNLGTEGCDVDDVNITGTAMVSDTTAPDLEVVHPVEGGNYDSTGLDLNYSVSDSDGNLDACWYSLDGGVSNSTIAGCSNTTITASEGSNSLDMWANDTFGNVNNTSVGFDVTLDGDAPFLEIGYPIDGGNYGYVVTELNYTAYDLGGNLDACWYSLDGGANNVSVTCGNNVTGLSAGDGSYVWSMWANDTYGNVNYTTVSFDVSIDSTSPSILIVHPADGGSYNYVVTELNYSASDDVALDSCWYSLDGGVNNVSVLCSENVTGLDSGQGSANWMAWANDTSGNEGSDSVTFEVDSIVPVFSGFVESPANGSNYSYGQAYGFNVSVSDSGLDYVWIEFEGVNYSVSNVLDEYYLDVTGLAAGKYGYEWWANDTKGNVNSSGLRYYDVSLSYGLSGSLTNSTSWDIVYGAEFTVGYSESNEGDGDVVYEIFRDGTGVGTGESVTLGAGEYEYVLNSTQGQNYSASNLDLQILNISKATGKVNLTLNGTDGNVSVFVGDSIELNASILTGNGEIEMYKDGVLINVGEGSVSNVTLFDSVGVYNISAVYGGNENYTSDVEEWFVNVEGDLVNPSVENLTEYPTDPAIYVSGQDYEFNVTVADNTFVDNVLLEFEGVNYSSSNSSNVYSVVINDLGVGNYTYKWIANDSYGNMNASEVGSYSITPAQGNVTLLLNGFDSDLGLVYGDSVNATAFSSSGNVVLYRDGVNIDGENGVSVLLGAGYYNYTGVFPGQGNHSKAYVSHFANVSKAGSEVALYLNGTRGNVSIYEGSIIDINTTLSVGGNIEVYVEDSLIYSGSSPSNNSVSFGSTGNYSVNVSYGGNENYTGDVEEWFVEVLGLPDVTAPNLEIGYPLDGSTYDYVIEEMNYTAYDLGGNLDACWYSLDGGANNVSVTCGNNVTGLSAGDGSYVWSMWANDTYGNVNYTTVSFDVSIDSTSPSILIVHPADGGSYNSTGLDLNYSVSDSDGNLDACWYSLDGGVSNSTIAGCSNTTITASEGSNSLDMWANDTFGNVNNTSVGFDVTLPVDVVAPEISIVYPLDGSNFSSLRVDINYSASDDVALDSCWYSNSSGTYNNSINCAENITGYEWDEGENRIYVWANDTSGNVNVDSVGFNISLLSGSLQEVVIDWPSYSSTYGNKSVVSLNYSVGSGYDVCWYSLDGGTNNVSLSGCGNETFSVSSDGKYEIYIWVNESVSGLESVNSTTFYVNDGLSSVHLGEPYHMRYVNHSEVEFSYLPYFGDGVEGCELWGDFGGSYARNLSDSSIENGLLNNFKQNLTEGTYSWAINCSGSAGDVFSGNRTIVSDFTPPNVSLIETSGGEYTAPASVSYDLNVTDSSPVSCNYNLTILDGGLVIADVINCTGTIVFNISVSNTYVVNVNAEDAAGNTETSTSSFTVSGSSGGGGGGDGGGGGGSSGTLSPGIASMSYGELPDLEFRTGRSSFVSIKVTNTGSVFLNECELVPDGEFSSFVASDQVEDLSPGESVDFVFDFQTPSDLNPGSYDLDLEVVCDEAKISIPAKFSILASDFAYKYVNAERVDNKLKVDYLLSNLLGENLDISIDYKLVSGTGNNVVEGDDVIFLSGDAVETPEELWIELPQNSVGEFRLVMNMESENDELETSHRIVLSSRGLTGLAISDANRRTLTIFGAIVLLVGLLYFVLWFVRKHYKRTSKAARGRSRRLIKLRN